MWESHKEQQAQLKELKVKLEYEKKDYKKDLEERSKVYMELEEIKLKARAIVKMKEKILILKGKLKDTYQMSKQRDGLISKKGRLISSIKGLQTKIKTWR